MKNLKDKFQSAKGYLIDYDGLLVDTESIYYQTWSVLLDSEGQKICRDFHKGRHESEVYEKVRPHLLVKKPLNEISATREKLFLQIIEKDGISFMSGWTKLLDMLRESGPLFIVSNSTLENVTWGLKNLNATHYFDNIFGYSETAIRKPDPFLYNLACSVTNIPKQNLIAFEDSISGILAAVAAKVYVVAISGDLEVKHACTTLSVPYFDSANSLLREVYGLTI